MPYINCEKCGTRICVSEIDFQNGTYPKVCYQCSIKPKAVIQEDITVKRSGEDSVFGGEEDEVLKDMEEEKPKRKYRVK